MNFLKSIKPGQDFKTGDVSGGFKRKLKRVVKQKGMKSLADNIDDISSVVKNYKRQIRSGGLNTSQKNKIYSSLAKKKMLLIKIKERLKRY